MARISRSECRFRCSKICCWRKRSREPKPKPTPLPWIQLVVTCAVIFVNVFGITVLFPFLPFIIHDFFPNLNKTELGNKAGYLGSAYFVGSFIGNLLWGRVSDKIGRRPVLLMGMLGTLATELLFGFSQNFAWAVAARFLWGLLNGNLGVAKTYISEICDDSNQASGFAAVGTTAGLGRLMGSVIGGYLAQPASKFGPLQHPFFCKYPYSLPCIVGGGFTVISFVAAFLLLEESLHSKRTGEREDNGPNLKDSDLGSGTTDLDTPDSTNSLQSIDSGIQLMSNTRLNGLISSDTELINVTQPEIDDDDLIIVESDMDTDSDFDRVNSDSELLFVAERDEQLTNLEKARLVEVWRTRSRNCLSSCLSSQCGPRQWYDRVRNSLTDTYGCLVGCVASLRGCGGCRRNNWTPGEVRGQSLEKFKGAGRSVIDFLRLILDRRVFVSTFLYGSFAFLVVMCNELVPLLLVTDHESGGYNMDDSEIGVVLMSVAVLQLLWQALLYPRIAKCLGYRYTFLLGVLLFGAMSLLFPFANKITGPIADDDDVMSISMDPGSGSGYGLNLSDPNVDDHGRIFDFCVTNMSSEALTVNENSVKRVPVKVWLTLVAIVAVWITSRVMAFTSVMVFISNSSLPETRGTVNGYGQALCSVGRSLGPITGAPLFAWSENTGRGWPLNHHFVFDLTAVGVVFVAAISFLLPKSIELKRTRDMEQAMVTQGTPGQVLDEVVHCEREHPA